MCKVLNLSPRFGLNFLLCKKVAHMFDMMKKLQEAQQQMKKIKERLETIQVSGKSSDGSVTVFINGNRKVMDVQIIEEASASNRDQLSANIKSATNNALEAAEKVNEAEMKAAAGAIMPGMGGLFGKS